METPREPGAVTPDAVRAQLDRILAAETFANATRISRLLRYVVERTLAGDGAQLKEYVLGVDVFDRDESYDPRLDSIVRVEVRRLRARLDEYYRGPGAADPIVIRVPLGAYAPIFMPANTAPAAGGGPAPPGAPEPSAHPGRAVRALAAVALGAVVLAAILVTAAVWRRAASPAEAAASRSVAVLPFEHFSTDAADAMTAARLTDRVTVELARLGTLSVVSRTTTTKYAAGARPARDIARELGADIVMESTVTIDNGHATVVARLVSGERDRKIWVGEFAGPVSEIERLSRRIAADAAAFALAYRSPR